MNWWTRRGSNPRPPHCERGALPAELLAHGVDYRFRSGYNLIYRSKEIKKKVDDPTLLTNPFVFAIVCRLETNHHKKENQTMRERQKELRRRRKRREETLRARSKTAKAEAAAKKGK